MPGTCKRICHISDIPAQGSKELKLDNMSLIAVKIDEVIYFYRNCCPHLGLPLQWRPDQFLTHDKSLILCSTHGALFEIDSGLCIAGPCQSQSLEAVDYYIEDEHIYINSLK